MFRKQGINENETIIVDNWQYIVNAVDIYSNYSSSPARKRTLNNFLLYDVYTILSEALPIKYLEAKLEMTKVSYFMYLATNK